MSTRLYPISAVILAHQYSDLFEKVVQSVTFCNEIVIVASEEVPEIKDLCQRVSAKYFYRKFDGYGAQKQYAISLASHDWILNLDSDEWMTLACQKEIIRLLSVPSTEPYSAFKIRQKFIFLNHPLNFSGTRNSPVRFFHRKKALMNSSSVHEEVRTSGKVGFIREPIFHYSYASLNDYLFKFNKYTSLAAEALYQKGKRTNGFFIWGRLPFLFLRRYIFQLGFLDGYYGFVWCLLSAGYSSIKYLKLQELTSKEKA